MKMMIMIIIIIIIMVGMIMVICLLLSVYAKLSIQGPVLECLACVNIGAKQRDFSILTAGGRPYFTAG